MIREGKLQVAGKIITKCGHLVNGGDDLVLLAKDHPYVSRGGLKLEAALTYWNIAVEGLLCVDIGSSTGGFTDCLLQRGALQVFAIDVGTEQMHSSLRQDPRVRLFENKKVQDFEWENLPRPADLVVLDVSFVSLKQVLDSALNLLRQGGVMVALLKPQFELGPQNLDSRGIVKSLHLDALPLEWLELLSERGLEKCAWIDSPILGGDGNREFLLFAQKK